MQLVSFFYHGIKDSFFVIIVSSFVELFTNHLSVLKCLLLSFYECANLLSDFSNLVVNHLLNIIFSMLGISCSWSWWSVLCKIQRNTWLSPCFVFVCLVFLGSRPFAYIIYNLYSPVSNSNSFLWIILFALCYSDAWLYRRVHYVVMFRFSSDYSCFNTLCNT